MEAAEVLETFAAVPFFEVDVLMEFEGNSLGYYIKGHKPVDEFVASVAYCHLLPSDEAPNADRVRHEYWRVIPESMTTVTGA